MGLAQQNLTELPVYQATALLVDYPSNIFDFLYKVLTVFFF